jgi:3-phytase
MLQNHINPVILKVTAIGCIITAFACNNSRQQTAAGTDTTARIPEVLKPAIITDTVANDTDDPAIWINAADPSQSLIVGTDKDENGGLYVFDLTGKEIKSKTIKGLKRPNNVDIEYGLLLNGISTDIAVVTERFTHKLRIYSLPDMRPVDNGGIPVFEGETQPEFRDLMGIALFKNAGGKIYAIAGRKTGPTDSSYLWEYELSDNGKGYVKATLVRKFGKYSGVKEIESIAVDDRLGYVYYSDEGEGIRKYYADPSKGNEELALFGKGLFKEDNEGISIYASTDTTGYILISNQQANTFMVFNRESSDNQQPQQHKFLVEIPFSTLESDGSDVTSIPLNASFPKGLFVAMSNGKVFHYYDWKEIENYLKK